MTIVLLALAAFPGLVEAQTTVTFDNPVPSGGADAYINGIFQGIDFGTNQWRWSGPYASDPSNNVYFANSTGTTRTFNFSPGPRVLTSLNVYTVSNGTLTVSDGVNPTVTRTVNTGSMVSVATGWTLGATTVTIGFTAGWALGVDDLTYTTAGTQETTPPTVQLTAPTSGANVTGTVALTATAQDNVGVVGVQFLVDGATAGAEDLTAPYAINWDSTTVANGTHSITARARDAAGNTATSTPPVSVNVNNVTGGGFGSSLRFNGNGVNNIDRVKIQIDDPTTNLPGPPVDVGATDFTIEFWINGTTTENTSALVQAGTNDNWKYGNIIMDRDRYNQDRAYGISVGAGRISFGVKGQSTGNYTIVGNTNVMNNQWHHIAVERRRSDGFMWLYVDGVLDASANGPDGDISYPDDGVPGNFCNGACTNSDPFIVIGAEKHDAGTDFPSYHGLFDELQFSTVLRYSASFTRPSAPFAPDANTVGLYHFDEGSGDYIYDSANAYGGPTNAVRYFGGSPAGPVWMSTTPFSVASPASVGQWGGIYPWPEIAIHMALLPNGQVLTLDGETYLNIGGTSARMWNPATGVSTPIPNNFSNLFCSGHSLLPDGRLLVAGGDVDLFIGIRDTNIYNPFTNVWTRVADMNQVRWYPTTVTLGDGRLLTVSGSTTCDECIADIPEVYNPANNTWTSLGNGARLQMTGTYPFLFVIPDGRVLLPTTDEDPMATYALNVSTGTWTTVDPNVTMGGAAVSYSPGKIMKCGRPSNVDSGGSLPTVTTTYVIDMNQPSPAWRITQPMAFPRGHHNLTLLPDGTTLVTGGGRTTDGVNMSQAVLDAEIWSPDTETWRTVAPAKIVRLYHSTAVLLPDGRVLSAGSGRFTGYPELDQFNSEIYSPPYLFHGERPIITSVPSSVQYGTTFFVGNANPSSIGRVTLVAPGATTHQVNMNQRFIELSFTQTSGGLNVTMPANPNMAPPGYYMLFLVGVNGVPSVAPFIQVTASAQSAPVPAITSLSPNSAVAGGVAFTLTVNGSGFVPTSVVRWNGSSRTTTYVSANQLTATIAAADISSAGTPSVTVFTPAPGGGTSNAMTFTVTASNPLPATTSLSPSSATAGGAAFTLTVNGSNFINGSTVRWNSSNRTTTYVSASQLTAAISAADIANAGTASVTVFTGSPGGGTSNGQTFTINATNPVPTTSGISPSTVTAGGAQFSLIVTGTNFVSGASTVQLNSSNRTTAFNSSTQLTATIPAADIASAGTAQITVVTAGPGGGTSNAQTLTIAAPNPVPATSSISPTSANAGSAAFTLTVNGSNFINGSTVRWNGSNRTTTFVNANQLTASIAAADVATAGTVSVTVFTSAPGGGTSNAQTFTINGTNPVPATTSLSPTSAVAGSAAFTLTVNGSNFVNGAIVRWNGSDRTTTFSTAAQLTAAITAADVATSGSATVTVFNPAPGGGTSNGQTFTISPVGSPPAGLVASYNFNIGSGTAVADTSGNNNNGTVANGTWTTSGRNGSALVFNGTSTLVTVPDSNSLDLTAGMTLEAWVYPTVQPTSWRGIIVKEQPNNVIYYLYAGSSTNNAPATGVFTGGVERTLFGGTRLTANTWVHLAATYDGANQRLYVNGTQVSSRAQTGAMNTSTGALRIGGNSIWGEYFTGRIDDVRIYNRALTAGEIATDMNTAVP